MTRIGIHQPETFPWAGYFNKMMNSDLFIILNDVQYKKNNFQNRNRILMNDRPTWLTLPVDTKGRLESTIRDMQIADTIDWKSRTLHLLEVAYSKCPYYKDIMDKLDKLISSRSDNSLIDFNLDFIYFIRSYLNIHTPIKFSSELGIHSHKTDLVFDICEECGADVYLSGEGGRDYLDLTRFNEEGIEVVYQEFNPSIEYKQKSSEFVHYMSVLDIIMNNSVEESIAYIENAFSFVK